MTGMKQPTPRPTRNCAIRNCQRHDSVRVRFDVTDPATGDLISIPVDYCEAHAPEVWDLRFIRESIEDALAAA